MPPQANHTRERVLLFYLRLLSLVAIDAVAAVALAAVVALAEVGRGDATRAVFLLSEAKIGDFRRPGRIRGARP